MVKFGRKFFFDKTHKKNNYTIPIIIVVAIILIASIGTAVFVAFYNKKDKPKTDKTPMPTPKVVLQDKIEIEVYEEIPAIDEYFKKTENIQISDFEIIYPEELNLLEDTSNCEQEDASESCKKYLATTVGEYKINLKTDKLDKKDYTVNLNVVDTTVPTLTLKNVTITEGSSYKIEDFIKSCEDNSKLSCEYLYAVIDTEGNKIDYSSYTKPGKYEIGIYAKDQSGNPSEVIDTTLTIKKKQTTQSNTCKYGNLKYSDSYVLAVKVDNKKCAVSIEEANDLKSNAATKFNKMLAKEIKESYLENKLSKLNLEGEIKIDITYGLVPNTKNTGIVGYYLASEARQTVNGKTVTIARYFVNESGNHIWKVNTLNLD